MQRTIAGHNPDFVPGSNVNKSPSPQNAGGNTFLRFISHFLPHDTTQTTCPPAALACGEGPLIIVPSLMRSGTHLLLDSLFNNFPTLRRRPLFVDFDAYERASLPIAPLNFLTGTVIKTHFPQMPMKDEYASTLAALAANAVIIRPIRDSVQVRKSLEKWGQVYSAEEFEQLERQFENFWAPYPQLVVDFSTLLDPEGLADVMYQVKRKTGLRLRRQWLPLMPARSRVGVYLDKILTRVFGCKVRRVNTTIGYRIKPKNLA